ncbi:MAG: AAA domain-containing protein, partial [Acidimicrobiia bacterium]
MVVTPFNAQLAALRDALVQVAPEVAPELEIGTLDSFQGREAALVILSTGTSQADLAPRGIDFIFDRARFNVAISRARAKFVWVGNPDLVTAQCRRPEQIRKVNALSRFLEVVNNGWEPQPAIVIDRDRLHRNRLGELMRDARLARGQSQAALAQRIDRSPSLISKMERGETVSEESWRKVTRALGWRIGSVRAVLAGEDPSSGLYRVLEAGLGQLDGLLGR